MVAEVQKTHLGKFALEEVDLVRKRMIDARRNHHELIIYSRRGRAIQPSGAVELSAEVAQSDKAGERTVFDSSKRS